MPHAGGHLKPTSIKVTINTATKHMVLSSGDCGTYHFGLTYM